MYILSPVIGVQHRQIKDYPFIVDTLITKLRLTVDLEYISKVHVLCCKFQLDWSERMCSYLLLKVQNIDKKQMKEKHWVHSELYYYTI